VIISQADSRWNPEFTAQITLDDLLKIAVGQSEFRQWGMRTLPLLRKCLAGFYVFFGHVLRND
jgi:hypothetical protein